MGTQIRSNLLPSPPAYNENSTTAESIGNYLESMVPFIVATEIFIKNCLQNGLFCPYCSASLKLLFFQGNVSLCCSCFIPASMCNRFPFHFIFILADN